MIPHTSLVIVHYNTPELLDKQLQKLKKAKDLQIIAVDNFSSEETTRSVQKIADSAREKGTSIFLITNHENLGFARACNQGVAMASGQWLLFLNPDVTITLDQVREFIKKADEQGLDAASPIPKSDDYNKPLPSTLSLLVEFTPLKHIAPLSVFKQKTLTGGCLLLKKEVLEALGGWDEDFFLWFEDSDLTKRLIDGGYKVGWVESAVKHEGGVALRQMPASAQRSLFFTSMQLYASKHFSPLGRLIVWALAKRYML